MQYLYISVFKILSIVFFVTIFIYGALNYSGFCFKEMRYLSDEEKIKIALDSIIKEQTDTSSAQMRIDGYGFGKPDVYIYKVPYKSAEAFIRENPNCCKDLVPSNGIFAEDPSPSLLDRVLGRYSYGIRVSYIEKRIEFPKNKVGTEGTGERHDICIHGFLPYGNCGHPCENCMN